MTDTKGDFDAWYETIQAMLSDEEAVKLANQIAELKKQFQLLALRGLKTDLFELASNNGSVFTENAQNAYVFLKQIYGKSEIVNDAFVSVGESGTLEFDSVDATNENISSVKLTTGMPLRGFAIDDVSVANYTDVNGKYWLCDSIELSVDGYWYCIKRVGSILSYSSEDVGTIYKTATGTLDKGKQVLYKLSNYVVSKLTDEEQGQLSELLSYGGGKLPAITGSNAAEAIQLHVEQNATDENGAHNLRFRNGSLQYKEGNEWKDANYTDANFTVDSKMSDTSENPVQNKVIKKYVDEHAPSITVDSAMSDSSANPVQNKVVKAYVDAKKVPTIGIENIFTGNPFAVIADSGGLATVGGTRWEQDNGGYHVEDIKYPAGGSVSLTVSMTLPANSIVLIDVNTLNYENIKLQGTCIKYNLTSSPSNTNLSIFFSGRNAIVTVATIRYMPLVIHLG